MNQESVLFKRSLYENILYGKLDATKEEVFSAAKKASIDDFINEKIDYKNNMSSKGQKQRICLARIFIKNPNILLLENITNLLEKENSDEILRNISVYYREKTLINVTHDLNSINKYNKILVMSKGNLFEQGTHDELIAKKGKYYDLYQKFIK